MEQPHSNIQDILEKIGKVSMSPITRDKASMKPKKKPEGSSKKVGHQARSWLSGFFLATKTMKERGEKGNMMVAS